MATKKTRIEIHLEKTEVKKLDEVAKKDGRSRKNFCEKTIKNSIKNYGI